LLRSCRPGNVSSALACPRHVRFRLEEMTNGPAVNQAVGLSGRLPITQRSVASLAPKMAIGQARVIAQGIGMLWGAVLGGIGRVGADCVACRRDLARDLG